MAASRGEQVQRAELLADLGRYDEATDELRSALDADSTNVDALAMLGYLRLRTDQPAEAWELARQAAGLDPRHGLAVQVRDQALIALGRADEVPPESPAWAMEPADQTRPFEAADAARPFGPAGQARTPEPVEPALQRRLVHAFTRMVLAGSVYCWVAPVLVAALGRSQLFAGVLGICGIGALVWGAGQLPGSPGAMFGALQGVDPWLARAGILVAATPALMVAYAVTAYPWALGAVIAAGAAALIILFVVRADFETPGA